MPSDLVRRPIGSRLLVRLLDDPQLVPALRALPAPRLRALVERVGLEDSGELLALATVEQLRGVFDEDLWRSPEPGGDEHFDRARFLTWLEVLLEGGEDALADRLAELSDDFLAFAVSQLARVLDTGVVAAWAASPEEAERLDRLFDENDGLELDAHWLVARGERGWDAMVATVRALDDRHPARLRGVLERCAAATHAELDGSAELEQALLGDDALLEDALGEREVRRGARGYVSPADARAFLALARTPPETPAPDPITHAHFRDLAPEAEAGMATRADAEAPEPAPLRALLLEAGEEEAAPRAEAAPGSAFRRALGELAASDPCEHARMLQQLAYLANVLVAGDDTRRWLPVDAAEQVLALCDAGLAALAGDDAPDTVRAREILRRWGVVAIFRSAWSASHGAR